MGEPADELARAVNDIVRLNDRLTAMQTSLDHIAHRLGDIAEHQAAATKAATDAEAYARLRRAEDVQAAEARSALWRKAAAGGGALLATLAALTLALKEVLNALRTAP